MVEESGVEEALGGTLGHRPRPGGGVAGRVGDRSPRPLRGATTECVREIAKAVSVFGGEQLELEVYERELAAGKTVLVVGVDAEEERVEVADALHELGATNLLYHGDWTFESLGD